MANNERTRKIARAQASGKTARVRREIPAGFYATLILIIILGVAAIGYSKYQLDHPTSAASSSVQPAVGITWYSVVAFDDCGTYSAPLAKSPKPTKSSKPFISSLGNGVIKVQPQNSSEIGHNANLGALVAHTSGLSITKSGFRLPGGKRVLVSAGCRGKPAKFGVYVWPSLLARKPVLYTDPANVLFENDAIISVAVLPKGAEPKLPPDAAAIATVGG